MVTLIAGMNLNNTELAELINYTFVQPTITRRATETLTEFVIRWIDYELHAESENERARR